jgi:hypothetical protein
MPSVTARAAEAHAWAVPAGFEEVGVDQLLTVPEVGVTL